MPPCPQSSGFTMFMPHIFGTSLFFLLRILEIQKSKPHATAFRFCRRVMAIKFGRAELDQPEPSAHTAVNRSRLHLFGL